MKLKKISIITLILILLSACSGSGEVTNPEPKTAVATEKPPRKPILSKLWLIPEMAARFFLVMVNTPPTQK